jgi:hypothetical protein
MLFKRIIVFFSFFIYIYLALVADNFEIIASVNAEKIGIDDVLIYTLIIKGIRSPDEPSLNDLEDFNVVQTSQSTQFKFVNGASTYYTNFEYYLTPKRIGMLMVEPYKYSFQGREYETKSFIIEVVKGSMGTPIPKTRKRLPSVLTEDNDLFSNRRPDETKIDVHLKVVLSKREVLLGEQVMYRVMLYSRNRIKSFNPASNQSFPGFWQEWFPVSPSIDGERKTLNGKVYQVYEIRKAGLFPTRTGSITIPSIRFELTLLDNTLSSLFSETRQIFRSTPEVTIQVSGLPQEAQELPVGDFSFDVTPESEEIDINDILGVKLFITIGKGNSKTLEIPKFTSNEYFKVYPAKISRKNNFDNQTLTGEIEAEIPISFKKTGKISLPSLEFKYFNPDLSQIMSLRSKPYLIHVQGVKEKEDSAISIYQTEIIKKGEDIAFIKKGNIYDQNQYFYKTTYFKIFLILFFLLNLLFLIKIIVYDGMISQSTRIKNKKLLNNTLIKLHRVRDYGAISPILEEYLKNKIQLGLSEINNQRIYELLSKYKINDIDIRTFIQMKSESDLSRFSPQKQFEDMSRKASERKIKNDVKKLEDILRRIDSKIK